MDKKEPENIDQFIKDNLNEREVEFKEDYWKEEPIKTSGRRSWTNTKRGGKTKQYRLKLKIEELERRLKILT